MIRLLIYPCIKVNTKPSKTDVNYGIFLQLDILCLKPYCEIPKD